MTKEEILKEKGITELTAFHAYPYLYRATIEAMDLYAQQQTEELRKEYDMFKKNTAFREGLEIQARGRRDEEIEQLMDKNEKMLELIRKCEKFINLLLIPIRDRDQLLSDIEKLNPKP